MMTIIMVIIHGITPLELGIVSFQVHLDEWYLPIIMYVGSTLLSHMFDQELQKPILFDTFNILIKFISES